MCPGQAVQGAKKRKISILTVFWRATVHDVDMLQPSGCFYIVTNKKFLPLRYISSRGCEYDVIYDVTKFSTRGSLDKVWTPRRDFWEMLSRAHYFVTLQYSLV